MMRSQSPIRAICLFLAILALIFAGNAWATILKDQKGIGWLSKRNLSSDKFAQLFTKYSDKGYLMIDIDAYPAGDGRQYSMVWRKNTDKRGWAEHRDMNDAAYSEKWVLYRDRGWRPLDIAAYPSGNTTLYAGIWVENSEGFGWKSYRDLTSEQYGELFTENTREGFRLVDMEVYPAAKGLRYTALWYENVDRLAWAQLRDMTREKYLAEFDARSSAGFRVVDYESYDTNDGKRYAAIWEEKPGFAWQVRTDLSGKSFSNWWRTYRDQGYRLVDFERHGNRYSGIWAENASRYRYEEKQELDARIDQYKEDNNLPGISVSIIRDGKTLYRRGFGKADIAKNKVAHSETVYNLASVSKVVGGTLAAKLEDELVLRNGNNFFLDLSDPSSDYLPAMPAQHTHTVEQLLSHLGCVGHYSTNPSIANQTTHYNTASQAVASIWNVGLVNNCTIGTSRSYSTPAFTFAGAVLEQATGRTLKQLLRNELTKPYSLGMRIQFSGASLPKNYERAVPYTNDNDPTSYSDNSWKVFGGGLETSAYQLARFGWKVLDAQILSVNARDNRLWTQVNPNQRNGLGWIIRTRSGRRVAEHDGSWTGTRTYLRVFRDDGLVVAVMSNRRGHTVDDVSVLTADLANIVLN